MMERFGLVLVATFAAGMFCGPLFCVIYSRSRRHRKLQPGPRQLKNARRQLVSVAGSSARLGAQRWEMAMGARSSGSGTYSGPSLRGTGPGGAATSTAETETDTRVAGGDSGSPVGGGGDVTRHPYQPPGGAGEDDDDNDCPICIGPLFPRHDREEAPDTRLSTTYASSTQACISNGRDGTAGGGRGHGVLATWGQSLRRQLRVASSPLSSRARQQQQPEMASAGHGLTHSLLSRRPWRGGQPQGVHDSGRVQTRDQEGIWQDDTPDSAPLPDSMGSAGANPGRNLMTTSTSPPSVAAADRTGDGNAACNLDGEGSAGATRVSQGGNVLEGIHDSDAKTRMTPVYLAAGSTGSTGSLPAPTAPSAGREGGDAKTSRRNAQPLTSTIATTTGNAAVLTAPAPAVCRGDDGTAVLSPPRSSVSPRSTEGGRGEPSGANTTTTTTTPRRPANAIVRASRRAAATVVEVLSPSRGVRRASLIQRRHDREVNGDDDTDDDASGDDFDTEILVLQGCRHAFHARCLTTWFLAEGYDCPVCRTPYWMRRERMARALQNERNGLPLDHGEDEIRARALASGYWGPMGGTAYSAIGGTIVVVRAPPTRTFTYPTDRRAWEVYLP